MAAASGQRAALLLKASALRRLKRLPEAISAYQQLLASTEDFEARLGLAYALLAGGHITSAAAQRQLLTPADAGQQAAAEELQHAITRLIRPRLDGQYDLYEDSDGNRSHKYTLLISSLVHDWQVEAGYKHTQADEGSNAQRAAEFQVRTATKRIAHFGILGLEAGLGAARLGEDAELFLTGRLKIDTTLRIGALRLSVAREALTTTAQLIQNTIRMTKVSLGLSRPLTARLSILAEYHYREYSDDNQAHDVQVAAQYTVLRQEPQLDIGYRVRWLDFTRQSGGGYFDPHGFMSPQVFGALAFERERFFGYVEASFGYQSFRRNRSTTNDFFGAGAGVFGIHLASTLRLTLNIEGGNYALGTSSGFNYYALGSRLSYLF